MTFYKQCVLTKNSTSQITYIPEEFAVVGRFLELKGDNGWEVMTVSVPRVREDVLANTQKWNREFGASIR